MDARRTIGAIGALSGVVAGLVIMNSSVVTGLNSSVVTGLAEQPAAQGNSPVSRTKVVDTEAVDGDTVHVDANGRDTTVRIIGTPETVHPDEPIECYGPEASAAAHRLLDGQHVVLITDPSHATTDTYGRRLAYVELDDGRDYGELMIHRGLAADYTYATAYEHQPDYREAQAAAQNAGRGPWSAYR